MDQNSLKRTMSFWVTLRKITLIKWLTNFLTINQKVWFGLRIFTKVEATTCSHNLEIMMLKIIFAACSLDHGAVWQSVTLLIFSQCLTHTTILNIATSFRSKTPTSLRSKICIFTNALASSSCQIGAPDYGEDPPTTIDQIKQKIKTLNLERDSGAPDVRFPCSCLDPTTSADKSQASLLPFSLPYSSTFGCSIHDRFRNIVLH